MKKWFAAVMLACLITTQLSISVLAKENSSVSAVSAYGLQDTLYTYVQMGDNYDGTAMQGRISSNTGEESSPVLLSDSNSTVRYLLMVDLSGSMKDYINDVNDFVRSLMEQEKMNAIFTVATFGERFETKAENLTDQKAVIQTLNNLEYNEQITNPYDGIINALTYLNNCPRLGGELVNLILITDGKPDLGYKDKTKEEAAEKIESQKALEKITNTPEVVLHTFGLGEWSKTAFSTFSAGTGMNVDAGSHSKTNATESGELIATYVDGLYRTDFSLSGIPTGERFDMKLSFTGQTIDGQFAVPEVELHSVPVLQNASSPSDTLPPASTTTETLPNIDSTEENPEESTTEEINATTETEIKNTTNEKTGTFFPILFLVVAIVALLIYVFKKKTSVSKDNILHKDYDQNTNADSAIFIRIEAISGQYMGNSPEIYLQNELLIGSGFDCDIVWQGEGIASKNSRIFIKNQIIYIEDLDSPSGTTLGGMRLYSPNRLRSGDEISIGTIRFRLWF